MWCYCVLNMTKHWMMMVWTCMFYAVRTYCSLFDPPTHCKTVEYCFFHVQWNSVIARADGPGTFSRYCRVLVIPKWRTYQGKQREIILARTPTAPCALEPDEDVRRERGEGERGLHTAQGRAFRCFSLLPATTRCALLGTWRRGGGGASGENFCDQEW